jgi:serine/threonine protein phosphatase 1
MIDVQTDFMQNRQPGVARLCAVSDIHGCYCEFSLLLERMALDLSRDTLIILGDLIDRGPDSYEVVRLVRQLQATWGKDHVIVLRGNHEQMALDYCSGISDWWNFNGNEFTLNSFARHGASVKDVLAFFASLPLTFEQSGFLFVHAGLNPHRSLAKQSASDMLWIRESFYNSRKRWPFTIVFGHTPTYTLVRQNVPVARSGWIAIDTGCVYGGCLTGVELKDHAIVQSWPVARSDTEYY